MKSFLIEPDIIIEEDLKWVIKTLKKDLRRYESGEEWVAIFDTDKRKDQKMIKKHIKAFKMVLDYYRTPEA